MPMAGQKRGYGTYRGRRTARDILKIIAAVLTVLVVLAGGVLIYGQNYIVYTDDGVRFDIPFPFFSGNAAQSAISEADPVNIEVKTAEPEPEPEPESEPAQRLIYLPISVVSEGRVERSVQEAGASGVILDMKNDQGQLQWYLEDALASSLGLVVGTEELNRLLSDLNKGDIYTVARISCFKDETLPLSSEFAVAIRSNSGYRWSDPDGIRWVSPASDTVQEYLIQRMVELAQMGFDEILLDNCGYPNRGNLGWIKPGAVYDKENLNTVIDAFLEKAKAALEPYNIILSIRCPDGVLTGEDTLTGLDAQGLEEYAQRIWVGEEITQVQLSEAGITRGEERLVAVVSAFEEEETQSQAQLALASF